MVIAAMEMCARLEGKYMNTSVSLALNIITVWSFIGVRFLKLQLRVMTSITACINMVVHEPMAASQCIGMGKFGRPQLRNRLTDFDEIRL